MAEWDFAHHLIQPMDVADDALRAEKMAAAMAFVHAHPKWRLSLQTHKMLGIPCRLGGVGITVFQPVLQQAVRNRKGRRRDEFGVGVTVQ